MKQRIYGKITQDTDVFSASRIEIGLTSFDGIGMENIMKKKFIVAVSALAFAGMILAGCGYDDSSYDITKVNVDKYVTDVGDYANMTISVAPGQQISESDIQGYIDYLLEGQSELKKSDKKVVENGDVVNIDYEGIKDGVAFDGGTDTGYDLNIGSGTFIDGFEDGLIGHKVGEEVALDLTFPEDYQATDLAGQAVVFNVKINYISESVVPELTDDIVKGYEIENVSTIAEYKEFVGKGLQDAADNDYLNQKRDAIQQALIDQSSFNDVTGLGLYNYYVEQIRAQAQGMADNYGVSIDDVITTMYGMTTEEYESSVSDQAQTLVKGALACEKIARKEKIKLSDEEFNAQLATDAADYGYASADDFKAAINADDYRNYLIQMKVVDKLLETATVTDAVDDTATDAASTDAE